MGKIEERISHIRSEIEELRITAEKSGVKHEVALNYSKFLDGLDLENKKNLPIFVNFIKEANSAFLEYLRDKTSIINKVSPKTSKIINEGINLYEKKCRETIKEFGNAKTPLQLEKKFNNTKFQMKLNEINFHATLLKNVVQSSYDCIIDTLFFED